MEEMDKTMEELLELIRSNKSDAEIQQQLGHYHDSDIADVIPLLSETEREHLYQILGKQSTSDVFTYLDHVEDYLDDMDHEKAADLIELMDADDAIDVLQELDIDDQKEIVSLMEGETKEDIQLLASYDEEQVGSKMTTNYITLSKNLTIKQAMKAIIEEAPIHDNISTIFMVDEEEKYYGSMELKDLIVARSQDDIQGIIHTSYPHLHSTDSIKDCIRDLKEYALDMIPVLDEQEHVIGVITSSDIVEVMEDEMNEDYAKLAGLTEEAEQDEKLRSSLKKRLPWLLLLLVLGLCVSLVISQFEAIISVIPMIVFFQSIVLGMAGNVGTQSLAVTIRTLVDENLTKKHLRKMVLKEVRIGLSHGLIIGLISFLVVFLFLIIRHDPIIGTAFSYIDAIKLSGSVFASLSIALTLASFVGTMIPILLKKLKFDPAVASGPLITTLNDMVAVVTYYGLSMAFFQIVL